MSRIAAAVVALVLMTSLGRAESQVQLNDQKDKDSYTVGYQFGENLRREYLETNLDVLLAAIKAGIEGREPAISRSDMNSNMQDIRRRVSIIQNRLLQEMSAKNRETGKAFLDANKKKEGVVALPSGLQYLVLEEGKGPRPKASDTVTVHYRGSLVDGTEFDSSYARGEPATLRVDGVIAGWTEALQLMSAGSKWRIFLPPELGYGERRFGRIPPSATLIFDIELISIGEKSGGAPQAGSKGSSARPESKSPQARAQDGPTGG